MAFDLCTFIHIYVTHMPQKPSFLFSPYPLLCLSQEAKYVLPNGYLSQIHFRQIHAKTIPHKPSPQYWVSKCNIILKVTQKARYCLNFRIMFLRWWEHKRISTPKHIAWSTHHKIFIRWAYFRVVLHSWAGSDLGFHQEQAGLKDSPWKDLPQTPRRKSFTAAKPFQGRLQLLWKQILTMTVCAKGLSSKRALGSLLLSDLGALLSKQMTSFWQQCLFSGALPVHAHYKINSLIDIGGAGTTNTAFIKSMWIGKGELEKKQDFFPPKKNGSNYGN